MKTAIIKAGRFSLKAFMLIVFTFLCVVIAVPAQADTQFYFLRHAEVDMKNPDRPLIPKGYERVSSLVEYMKDKHITHIYATHTDRTRDTVIPLAKEHGLEVLQFPKPGSTVGEKEITNRTKGKIAIKPMVNALMKVPDGSVVIVSANSGNLFAIMTGLGVHVGTKDMPCGDKDASCLLCKDKSCFPKNEFHNIWLVTVSDKGTTMSKSQYGEILSMKK
jgi:hypothetical protein